MNRIVITGASGFVGTTLCQALGTTEHAVRRVLRDINSADAQQTDDIALTISATTEWAGALANVDTVIHLAARVHVMNDTAVDPLSSFREVNTTATLKLAEDAKKAGVRRFIFLSSIKVNGEFTTDQPFDETTPAAPLDPYGISKFEAEQGLQKIAAESSMEVVIIRPPLIYGPGVKANFLRLLSWVVRGIPLPLASINNQRSMVAVDNLVDFIITCIDHPAAANETFLISDGDDLSTAELVRCIARETKHSARLFPFPQLLMKVTAALLGKKPMVDRLTHSLQIDSTKARELLQWQPPLSTDLAMAKTVAWYLQNKER